MKGFKSYIIPFLIVMFLFAIPAFTQDTKSTSPPAIKSIEVKRFDVKEGVQFPVTALDVMTNEIVDELVKLKKFSQVKLTVPPGTAATEPAKVDGPEPELVLTGTVTKYEPGNRAKRYLMGPFGGKTNIVAAIKITERATGKVLFEKDVDGKVIIGVFGRNSNGATRGLAKEVATTTKKAL
jgi:hypothetical protein